MKSTKLYSRKPSKIKSRSVFFCVSLSIGALVLICALLLAISYRKANENAELLMEPYSKYTRHYRTRLSLFSYHSGRTPVWRFYYDSPEAFDAASHTVELGLDGMVRGAHPVLPDTREIDRIIRNYPWRSALQTSTNSETEGAR